MSAGTSGTPGTPETPGTPGAGPDVSVRVAWSADAPAIADVQIGAWREQYAGLLPEDLLEALDPESFTHTWAEALDKPRDARNRVLVALERVTVRGFAVTGPADDPDCDPVIDGEVIELSVAGDHTRAGHGSRLLQACADTLRADRFTRAVTWLTSTDDVRRGFFAEAGWAPDGGHRELDLHGDGSVRVKQVRLHTDLTEP
ncbi:MAG: GNAT family N-acetyltransferase [Nocardioidaceae bacterium]